MEQEKQLTSLPENAYRELKPGEEYTPIMPASSSPREVTPYSVTTGIVMAIVFSAAAAFLGLKVGQVFEAAIPIAIIAVGMGNVMGKRNMLGQNVIIQSIGASSGIIVAGGQDEIVPPSAVQKLVDKLRTQKGITIHHDEIPRANHFFEHEPDQLMKSPDNYLDMRLAPDSPIRR